MDELSSQHSLVCLLFGVTAETGTDRLFGHDTDCSRLLAFLVALLVCDVLARRAV
jgi:hypothetical protein